MNKIESIFCISKSAFCYICFAPDHLCSTLAGDEQQDLPLGNGIST